MVETTIGAVIFNPGSTKRYKTGGWRALRPVVDESKCISCGTCWVFCPEGCIYQKDNKKFVANYDYCKGCGICANECPVKCIEMKMEEK